jgi:hypothetical protein
MRQKARTVLLRLLLPISDRRTVRALLFRYRRRAFQDRREHTEARREIVECAGSRYIKQRWPTTAQSTSQLQPSNLKSEPQVPLQVEVDASGAENDGSDTIVPLAPRTQSALPSNARVGSVECGATSVHAKFSTPHVVAMTRRTATARALDAH